MQHDGPLFQNWPFKGLEPHGYDLMMIDPPWDFSLFSEKGGNKSAQKHYRCLPIDQIKAFPIADLAAKDCAIGLWGTNPMLPLQLETMRYWGFKYKTMVVWRKLTKYEKVAFGTGYLFRSSHEFMLIGTRGSPKNTAKNVRSIFDGKVREHSRKPDEAYEMMERWMPKARRRVELFSRTSRPGWEFWGDEVGKFDERSNEDATENSRAGEPREDQRASGPGQSPAEHSGQFAF